MEDAARLMARSALQASFERLPASAIAATRNNLLDTIGCALAGATAPGCREVASLVLDQYAGTQAGVWGSGRRAIAAEAALANGTMAHALDFDDTHDAALLHAGVSVVPAALAVAEQQGGIDGRELITAVTVGLDWVCRMGAATQVTPVASGWMFTALFGLFGATAAAGRLLGLTEDRLAHAIGIAYAQAAGNTQCMPDGALTKRMQPGFAARIGVMSAWLARAGISGTIGTFDGKAGLYNVYLKGAYDRQRLLAELGTRFEGEDLSYKPYPACRHTHAAIDATLDLVRQTPIDTRSIERITVDVNEEAYTNVCTPIEIKSRPRGVVDAQFSIPYCVATALIRREVFIDDFSAAALVNDETLRLAVKVQPRIDAGMQSARGREASPARVEIELANGQVLACRKDSARGSPQDPMDFDALAVKFRRCLRYAQEQRAAHDPSGARASRPHDADELIELIRSLESLNDVRTLTTKLA